MREVSGSLDDPFSHAKLTLAQIIEAALAANRPVLFLSSGGSALTVLPEKAPNGHLELLTMSVLDERMSENPAVQNFTRFSTTPFFTDATSRGAHAIDPRPRPEETAPLTAARFEASLRSYFSRIPSPLVVCTMGIGIDGHTAGIFPDTPAAFSAKFDSPAWVVGYDAGISAAEAPVRITLTNGFLRTTVGEAIVVADATKCLAVAKMLSDGPSNEVPARITSRMKSVHIFTTCLV